MQNAECRQYHVWFLNQIKLRNWDLKLPVNKERWFSREKYYDIKKIHPVLPQGIGGNMGGKVHVAAGDDIQELPVFSQHFQPVSKLRPSLHYESFWMRLNHYRYNYVEFIGDCRLASM